MMSQCLLKGGPEVLRSIQSSNSIQFNDVMHLYTYLPGMYECVLLPMI